MISYVAPHLCKDYTATSAIHTTSFGNYWLFTNHISATTSDQG